MPVSGCKRCCLAQQGRACRPAAPSFASAATESPEAGESLSNGDFTARVARARFRGEDMLQLIPI